jgi:hypothetical protein
LGLVLQRGRADGAGNFYGKRKMNDITYVKAMDYEFNKTHLTKFKECYSEPPSQPKVGHKLDIYIRKAREMGVKINFPKTFDEANANRQLCRRELIELCKKDTDHLFCFCAIMAWGMRKNHFSGWKHFKNAISDYTALKEKIAKIIKANSSHEAFSLLNSENGVPGLGIPFFTKLIFFFRRDGYILDQWTAKSAKLLAPNLSIKVYKSGPAANTTPEQYDQFCNFVKNLADEMKNSWQPSDAETGMFGGRKKENEWRRYVINQFNQT